MLQKFSGALCNHVIDCTGFAWGSPESHVPKKCHLKSGDLDAPIVREHIVSGHVGCPTPTPVVVTDCAMIDKDLQGGDELRNIENVQKWQDCGNFMNVFCFVFSFLLCIMILM